MIWNYRKLTSPFLVLFAWELISRMGWVPVWFFPAPSNIFQALIRTFFSGELIHHLGISLARAATGYSLAAAVGIVFGLLIAWSIYAEDFFDPIIELVRPLSTFALVPVFFLWFGIGDTSKVLLIFKSCFFPIVINTIAGIKGVDKKMIQAARSLGANEFQVWTRVLIPAALPMIITGLRVATAMSMTALVGVEMLSGDSGLGFLVIDAQRTFDSEKMFAGILVLSVVGFSLDRFARTLQGLLLSWHIQTSLSGRNV